MSSASRTPRRARLGAFAAALGLGLLGMLATAVPAAAHDELIASDPADGSTVAVLPDEVTLTFSAFPLDEPGATLVEVTDATGADLAVGEPVVDGTAVTQALEGAPSGDVTVIWKVVSSDGHPIDGELRFEVEGAGTPSPSETATTAPATGEPTDDAPPAPATPSDSATPVAADDDAAPVLPWVIGGVLLIAAIAVVAYLIGSRARRPRTDGSDGDADTGNRPADED